LVGLLLLGASLLVLTPSPSHLQAYLLRLYIELADLFSEDEA
jgi:hypothetical protein